VERRYKQQEIKTINDKNDIKIGCSVNRTADLMYLTQFKAISPLNYLAKIIWLKYLSVLIAL